MFKINYCFIFTLNCKIFFKFKRSRKQLLPDKRVDGRTMFRQRRLQVLDALARIVAVQKNNC